VFETKRVTSASSLTDCSLRLHQEKKHHLILLAVVRGLCGLARTACFSLNGVITERFTELSDRGIWPGIQVKKWKSKAYTHCHRSWLEISCDFWPTALKRLSFPRCLLPTHLPQLPQIVTDPKERIAAQKHLDQRLFQPQQREFKKS